MTIQVRFADTDALGHLNNAAYAHYAELGRLQFLADEGLAVGGLILAHLSLDFRRQVRYGQRVELRTAVVALGTSSVRLRQRLLADGEVAADIGSVVVNFDYARGRAAPLPAAMRTRLEAYVETPSEPPAETPAETPGKPSERAGSEAD